MLAAPDLTIHDRSNPQYLYERLVGSVVELIRTGTLPVGGRLPAVRRCARQNGVSVSTVLMAYRRLEDLGLVEARPQSGFYVRSDAHELLPEGGRNGSEMVPKTVRVSSMAWDVFGAEGASRHVPLGHAVPDPALLPTERLGKFLAAAVRESGAALMQMMPQGPLQLRAAIARRLLEAGFTATPEEVVITSGSVESIGLCLRAVTRPGDAVAVESPTYFAVLKVLESLHLQALEIPTGADGGFDLDAAERVFRDCRVAACVVTPNGHNPTGVVMTDPAKQRLVELSVRFGVPLIEDDAQGDFGFSEQRPRSLRSFDADAVVLHCSSFAKTLAPGYRVGWIAAGPLMSKIMSARFASTVCAATPSQFAVAAYLERGGFDHHLRSLRRTTQRNLRRMAELVRESFPNGTEVAEPRAGTVLWVRMPESVDAMQLHQLALRRRISVTPGPIFSASGGYRNYIRLNGAVPWSARVREAVATLGELASGLAEGMPAQAVLDWMEIQHGP